MAKGLELPVTDGPEEKPAEIPAPLGPEDSSRGLLKSVLYYVIPITLLLALWADAPFNICDDACISLKVAVNAAEGGGFSLTAAIRVTCRPARSG